MPVENSVENSAENSPLPSEPGEEGPSAALTRALKLHRAGDLEGAIAGYLGILATDPGEGNAISSLGVALRAVGRNEDALAILAKGADKCPDNADLIYNLGNALRDKGDPQAAIERYNRVLALDPGYLGAALNLGICLENLRRFDDAMEHYGRAIRIHPFQPDLFHNFGVVLCLAKHVEAAIACYRRALALKSDYPNAWRNLGLALDSLGRHLDAEEAHRQALAQKPENAEILSGLAQCLLNQGRSAEARDYFQMALRLAPDLLEAHLGLARGRLLAGDLGPGWEEFKWRRKLDYWRAPTLDGAEWEGGDLAGKTVLLYWEQGLGDVIQFVRYAPLVAARGGTVLLFVPPILVRLLEPMEGVAGVHADNQPPPTYDLKCSLLDLPGIFATGIDDIPGGGPYLQAPESDQPERPPGSIFRVALVWAGNPEHPRDDDRSCPLDRFIPLLGIPGCSFFSLQTGPARDEIKAGGLGGLFEDLGAGLTDFAHTADILRQTDLLISVDTASAHLAGAMGLEVWTLLTYAPDWRWMLRRADTPWYASMRLYRQPVPHDWESVMAEIEKDLTARARAYYEEREGAPD